MNQKIEGLLRHILSFIGGILIATGWLDDGQIEGITEVALQIIGVVFQIIAVVRSFITKEEEVLPEFLGISSAAPQKTSWWNRYRSYRVNSRKAILIHDHVLKQLNIAASVMKDNPNNPESKTQWMQWVGATKMIHFILPNIKQRDSEHLTTENRQLDFKLKG